MTPRRVRASKALSPIDSLRMRLASRSIALESGCIEWSGPVNHAGYGVMGFGAGRSIRTNRAAWIVCKGEIGSGLNVLHRCDNPRCVNPRHLFLGTQLQNIADRHAKGRTRGSGSGASHHNAKLTAADVCALRALSLRGASQAELAARFQISRGNVSKIVRGKSYPEAS